MHAVIIILFVLIVNIYLAKKAQFFPVYSQFIHNSALRETKKRKILLFRGFLYIVDKYAERRQIVYGKAPIGAVT